jgi:hypothetical protein
MSAVLRPGHPQLAVMIRQMKMEDLTDNRSYWILSNSSIAPWPSFTVDVARAQRDSRVVVSGECLSANAYRQARAIRSGIK